MEPNYDALLPADINSALSVLSDSPGYKLLLHLIQTDQIIPSANYDLKGQELHESIYTTALKRDGVYDLLNYVKDRAKVHKDSR